MIWLLLSMVVMVSDGQLPIINDKCPAKIGQSMQNLREKYLETYREHQRLKEERKEIKKKYEKEIEDINEQRKTVEILSRENKRLEKMADKSVVVDCKLYHEKYPSLKSGVYELSLGDLVFLAYCDMETRGGGWTIFYRDRLSGTIAGPWQYHKEGFGDIEGYDRYWLGNEKLHRLTKGRPSEVYFDAYIQCYDYGCPDIFQMYRNLTISSESEGYRVVYQSKEISHSGNYQDYPPWPNNTEFSAVDRDNDDNDNVNCAQDKGNGWYDKLCHTNGYPFQAGKMMIRASN